MYPKPNHTAAYKQVTNLETDPLRQVVMLYDGAIKFLNLAAADIEAQDWTAKAEHSRRALAIISYLQSILDFERGGHASVVYDQLFSSVTSMVLRASLKLEAATIRQAANYLVPVRDAWETVASLKSDPSSRPAESGGRTPVGPVIQLHPAGAPGASVYDLQPHRR